MQCGFEFVVIHIAQRSLAGTVDDLIQFLHIDINAPASGLLLLILHDWLSSARKRAVSG
jgi:hypothetical protein